MYADFVTLIPEYALFLKLSCASGECVVVLKVELNLAVNYYL